ncbi:MULTISPECIES: ROK family transcriptional regulator [unclassified Microbacterium]|uniref:ROK family transcriptional regulator n=1 Tax=unclassified Microbacterium TaxID=2609290 RepID=UPI000EAA2025|nr:MULTISPECIES: ROK family transcriptional regulator [unclassified Microbacterium]MBT2483641.1 ROK family transcriptional regulator [Microbacterium sp. ISL-108]RKN69416.1 ROK family transcriptional regulator [Microbacterium sp. CGR2]
MPRESGDGVRARNLARVLRLVHVGGSRSRAQLTSATGLNRSTIADLVAELVSEGWVVEREPDSVGRVGRPSPVVEASPNTVVIAVNPEIDAVEIAAIDLARTTAVRERIESASVLTAADVAELVADVIDRWRQGALADARLVAVGVAVPGLVRAADGLVRNAPHLGWTDAPLGDLIARATGLPVAVGNDASLGALAEHLFGAAEGANDVVYLNGGPSGIGGGIIVHGAPVGGVGGYAGEFGQNRVGPGSATVLEDEVSRTRLLDVLGLGVADDATLADALAAASDDDPVREESLRQRGLLAQAIADAVNILNPSVVVLGGFLAQLEELDPEGFAEAVAAGAMAENVEGLRILPASLAADRLLLGAAEIAFTSAGVI